jgi:hypothetical protein
MLEPLSSNNSVTHGGQIVQKNGHVIKKVMVLGGLNHRRDKKYETTAILSYRKPVTSGSELMGTRITRIQSAVNFINKILICYCSPKYQNLPYLHNI